MAYVIVTIIGVLMPSAALLSFAVLMLFAVPVILIVIVVRRTSLSARPAIRWTARSCVPRCSSSSSRSPTSPTTPPGSRPSLWDDGAGFYFSENDVLHIGLILWLWYVVAVVGRHLRDASTGAPAADG